MWDRRALFLGSFWVLPTGCFSSLLVNCLIIKNHLESYSNIWRPRIHSPDSPQPWSRGERSIPALTARPRAAAARAPQTHSGPAGSLPHPTRAARQPARPAFLSHSAIPATPRPRSRARCTLPAFSSKHPLRSFDPRPAPCNVSPAVRKLPSRSRGAIQLRPALLCPPGRVLSA